MIKEAIAFVDKFGFNSEQLPTRKLKEKRFVIIKTKEENRKLVYDGVENLENDYSIEQWINKNKHYEQIMNNLGNYVLPETINKALGSTSGLATYSFFVFNLSEKNLGNLQMKIDKTKFSDEKDDQIGINEIQKILKDAIPDLTKKTNSVFQYLDYYVLIHTDKDRFEKWKKITDDFITERMSFGAKKSFGECFVCKSNGSIGTPLFLTNYDSEKSFLNHVTRNSIDGKGTPFFACSLCVKKLNTFNEILETYKLRIFPLFVKPDEINEEINSIKHDLQDNKNPFAFIFDQLKTRQDKNFFDFYLFVKSKDYFFFDYITGYKWEIGDYTNFFDKENKKFPITRQKFEMQISNILSNRQWINYFDDIKDKDNKQTSMIYSIRQKLFDFVYRNQNTLTYDDLRNIVLFRIEKEIRNNSVDSKSCKETLNLYFNKYLLLQTTVDENEIILNRVKSAKDAISSDNLEKFEIRNDDEWAYFAGQLAYYLVSLSKSKNKNYGLLEPFTNRSTTNLVKITIEQMIERYKHEINLNNKRFRAIATKVLSYEIAGSFMDLKIPFYVGTFDDNVIYSKHEEKENGDE